MFRRAESSFAGRKSSSRSNASIASAARIIPERRCRRPLLSSNVGNKISAAPSLDGSRPHGVMRRSHRRPESSQKEDAVDHFQHQRRYHTVGTLHRHASPGNAPTKTQGYRHPRRHGSPGRKPVHNRHRPKCSILITFQISMANRAAPYRPMNFLIAESLEMNGCRTEIHAPFHVYPLQRFQHISCHVLQYNRTWCLAGHSISIQDALHRSSGVIVLPDAKKGNFYGESHNGYGTDTVR